METGSPAGPSRWIWPLSLSDSVGLPLLHRARTLAACLEPWYCWALLGAVLGLLPFVAGAFVGWPAAVLGAALCVAVFVVAAAAWDWQWRALLLMASAFATHGVVAIALAESAPELVDQHFPAGESYWQKSRHWILTGENPEYDVSHWLPVHVLLVFTVAVTAYVSFGFWPLAVGFFQVNLMNVYVGRLVAESEQPLVALALGWHPWSMLRGLGFLILTYEVISLSLARLASRSLSTAARRWRRWLAALFFLALDVLVKYFWLEPCRLILADNYACG